jgi:hypothetical protein
VAGILLGFICQSKSKKEKSAQLFQKQCGEIKFSIPSFIG